MSFDGLLSASGLGEFVAQDFFAMQVGLLTLTALIFLCSFVLCLLAFRAAGGARRARLEAETQFRAAQDLAVEVRHLTAQIERATTRRSQSSVPSSPVRVSASESTEEAEVEILNASDRVDRSDRAPDHFVSDHSAERMLEDAKHAATVPSNLLGGLRRRRP